VIGSGSSAIQIVPAIQKSVKHLDNYARGKTWIATPFAATYVNSRGSEANCKSPISAEPNSRLITAWINSQRMKSTLSTQITKRTGNSKKVQNDPTVDKKERI
jgi:spore germination protein GerM